MFRLLDTFSASKNQAAPVLYKSLIFALIESPNDETARSLFYSGFKELYQSYPSIPISLLIEPLSKQLANKIDQDAIRL